MTRSGAGRVKGLLQAILWALILPACFSTGSKINDPSLTSKILVHHSSKSEVVALLGLPERVSCGQDGGEAWQYYHITEVPNATAYIPLVRAFADGFDWHTRQLVTTFDKNEVVKHLER